MGKLTWAQWMACSIWDAFMTLLRLFMGDVRAWGLVQWLVSY